MKPLPAQIGTRFKGDGLPNADHEWSRDVVNVRYEGEQPGDHIGLSFYLYGAMIYFGHHRGQLEFQALRSGGYVACCTLQYGEHHNEFQVRSPLDDNSITATWRDGEMPTISTEFKDTPLRIAPKGELRLSGDAVVIDGPLRLKGATITEKTKDFPRHLTLELDGEKIRIPLL